MLDCVGEVCIFDCVGEVCCFLSWFRSGLRDLSKHVKASIARDAFCSFLHLSARLFGPSIWVFRQQGVFFFLGFFWMTHDDSNGKKSRPMRITQEFHLPRTVKRCLGFESGWEWREFLHQVAGYIRLPMTSIRIVSWVMSEGNRFDMFDLKPWACVRVPTKARIYGIV